MIDLDRMLCSKVLKEVSEAHDCVDIQSDLNVF